MFETRALEPECLDDPCLAPAFARRSYRFMQTVNRRFGGASAVIRFLEANTSPGQTVRVLDLGCGTCDIPLAATQKLRNSGCVVEFTCLDINTTALALARRKLRRTADPLIHLVEADAFQYVPQKPFDFAIGSMFFHHLSDDRILELLQHLRAFVMQGIFINDLYRSRTNYLACRLAVLAAGPIVRHDALLSVRRGFIESDLRSLLERLAPAKLIIERRWFYRITAALFFHREPPQ